MVIHRVTDDSPRADLEAALYVLTEKRSRAELPTTRAELMPAIDDLLDQINALA